MLNPPPPPPAATVAPTSIKKELGGPTHKDVRGRVRITVKKAALLAQRAVLAAKVAAANNAPIPEEPPVVQPPSPTPARGGDDIDSLLHFIEGGVSKKELQKKAAKKAKQKQKRQDDKKVEELEVLRSEFHELFYREMEAKSDLKQIKNSKKTSKKSLAEAENLVKGMGKQRAKLEVVILDLIADLKRNNAEFKFPYLPSKEQQLEHMEKSKTQPSAIMVCKPPPMLPLSELQTNMLPEVSITDAVGVDPSKQMVTIRRLHTAFASEPQFTITTADKDKLLYRFVDGVLVPGKFFVSTP